MNVIIIIIIIIIIIPINASHRLPPPLRAIFCGVDNVCHCMTVDHHPDLKVTSHVSNCFSVHFFQRVNESASKLPVVAS